MITRRFYNDETTLKGARAMWPIPRPRCNKTWREMKQEARDKEGIDWHGMFDFITEEHVS